MGKAKPPPSPDPRETAAAQGNVNVSTAITERLLNNVNQVDQFGNRLDFSQTGSFELVDPLDGSIRDIPQFTQTQTLSPGQQAIFDTNQATQQNLANIGQQQSGAIGELLNDPFSISNVASPDLVTGIGQGVEPIQTGFQGAGDITRSFDSGFNRGDFEDALFQRLDRRTDIDRNALEQSLANRGIKLGSGAFSAAQGDFGQNVNDQRTAAILAGGQEQANQEAIFQARAQFANQAQGQQFSQNQTQAAFSNTAANQQLQQQLAQAQFANQARGQSIEEALVERNQPFQEINAVLSGGQIQTPGFAQGPQTNLPTVDFAGLVQQDFANQTNAANTRNTQQGQLFGGIASGFAGFLSDSRLKHDKQVIGTSQNGLDIYTFKYLPEIDPDQATYIGVMAQDLEKIKPENVSNIDGTKFVNYEGAFD